jgi:hypothetical protein
MATSGIQMYRVGNEYRPIRAADLGLGPVQVINMSLVMRHPSR